jgi:predicted RNA-binding Zn-ribbon protein involved in translation (DUF1610 family)
MTIKQTKTTSSVLDNPKPCPFCGERKLTHCIEKEGDFFECDTCGARGPLQSPRYDQGNSLDWNTRSDAEIERLKDQLDSVGERLMGDDI